MREAWKKVSQKDKESFCLKNQKSNTEERSKMDCSMENCVHMKRQILYMMETLDAAKSKDWEYWPKR